MVRNKQKNNAFLDKAPKTGKGVLESIRKPQDIVFLHRSYTPNFFHNSKKVFFRMIKKYFFKSLFFLKNLKIKSNFSKFWDFQKNIFGKIIRKNIFLELKKLDAASDAKKTISFDLCGFRIDSSTHSQVLEVFSKKSIIFLYWSNTGPLVWMAPRSSEPKDQSEP